MTSKITLTHNLGSKESTSLYAERFVLELSTYSIYAIGERSFHGPQAILARTKPV